MIIRFYTIGHSNHSIGQFTGILRQQGITAIADVRSAPYSRYHPQYNKDAIAGSLEKEGIKYVFLGRELGARPDDLTCYENGRVDFGRLAEREEFKIGLERVRQDSERYRIALMCAEKEPLTVTGQSLFARYLSNRGSLLSIFFRTAPVKIIWILSTDCLNSQAVNKIFLIRM